MIVYNYDADLEVSDTCVRSSLLSWVLQFALRCVSECMTLYTVPPLARYNFDTCRPILIVLGVNFFWERSYFYFQTHLTSTLGSRQSTKLEMASISLKWCIAWITPFWKNRLTKTIDGLRWILYARIYVPYMCHNFITLHTNWRDEFTLEIPIGISLQCFYAVGWAAGRASGL